MQRIQKRQQQNTWLKEKTFLSIPNPFSFSPAAVEVEDTSNPVFGKETSITKVYANPKFKSF